MQCLERHGTPVAPVGLVGCVWFVLFKFVGGFSGGVTPGPFPNPEAKPACADGTAPGRVWESRSPPACNLWLLRSWLLMILCGSSAAGAFSRFLGDVGFVGHVVGEQGSSPWGVDASGVFVRGRGQPPSIENPANPLFTGFSIECGCSLVCTGGVCTGGRSPRGGDLWVGAADITPVGGFRYLQWTYRRPFGEESVARG